MLKRFFDFIASLIGLLLLSPILLIVSILVWIKLGRPVFFTQVRPGLHGKPFKMIKFRTMTNDRDEQGDLLPNEERMTRFGKFLRSASLDELPELFNVLKGDMSLVGPRPLLMEYLPYFTAEQNRRHDVKPGITGWAQVNGRNAIGWDQKLGLDIWYVENRSLLLDLKILWLTLYKVVRRDGITHEGSVGMPRFDEYMKQQRAEE
ncbi:MAG: sugar transferase [Balneolaceae bacterium]|nr:sugar transferase [Balneolaceae bacterium]MCH8549469.1 sugar transferase [Balneolaceae bacterium]